MARNLDLVRNTYEAFARGDLETVLAAFAEDIEWIEPDGFRSRPTASSRRATSG